VHKQVRGKRVQLRLKEESGWVKKGEEETTPNSIDNKDNTTLTSDSR